MGVYLGGSRCRRAVVAGRPVEAIRVCLIRMKTPSLTGGTGSSGLSRDGEGMFFLTA